MKKLFVPYEIALLAKQYGFDEFCLTKFEPKLYTKPNGDQILSAIIQTTFLNGIPKHYEHGGFEGYKNSVKSRFGDEQVAAPLYQQLINWFKENFQIRFKIEPTINNKLEIFLYDIGWSYIGSFDNDNEAYNTVFKKAFELIKNR